MTDERSKRPPPSIPTPCRSTRRSGARPASCFPGRCVSGTTGLRIDEDVLAWFRGQGPGYQTRMNAVLRAYVEARKRAGR
jgi:uncharacterized protein (DUF4415 family)